MNAQTQLHKQLRVQVQRKRWLSHEETTICRNGGGGSALVSLMERRLLWCGQEELWESTPRGRGLISGLFTTQSEKYKHTCAG